MNDCYHWTNLMELHQHETSYSKQLINTLKNLFRDALYANASTCSDFTAAPLRHP